MQERSWDEEHPKNNRNHQERGVDPITSQILKGQGEVPSRGHQWEPRYSKNIANLALAAQLVYL